MDSADPWESLTADERRCVFAYQTLGTKAEAARRIGKDKKWLEYSQRAHPAFRQVMDSTEWPNPDLTRRVLQDLFAESMFVLMELVRSDETSDRDKLAAIKLVRDLGRRS